MADSSNTPQQADPAKKADVTDQPGSPSRSVQSSGKTEQRTEKTSATPEQKTEQNPEQKSEQPSSALTTREGRTTISDLVVSKIAGIATREVVGVHDLGGGASRAVGALRERIPGGKVNQSQGVTVEVGERQTAVDIDLVADYGVALADLAADIRRNVITAVEKMTGLEVTEVNVTVHDVFLDDGSEDSDESSDAPRVQ